MNDSFIIFADVFYNTRRPGRDENGNLRAHYTEQQDVNKT